MRWGQNSNKDTEIFLLMQHFGDIFSGLFWPFGGMIFEGEKKYLKKNTKLLPKNLEV